MIPFYHKSEKPIRNLPKLLRAYNSRGGSIVEVQRVVSCVFFSFKSSRYIWVPPNGSCALGSLPDTLVTLLFGWWSFFGFIWTMQVLVTNLCGGRDATEELLAATNGGNAKLAQQALDEELRERRQESIRAIFQFIGIVGVFALVMWLLVTVCDWWVRRPVSNRALATKVAEPNRALATKVAELGGARLQAIFYNANGRSTAMIGGTTVSVGERIGAYTVQAIGPQSVTVKSAEGQEKILHVSEGRE
jgi:hypothetical protein